MSFLYGNRMNASFKNIYCFTCHYKTVSINKVHRSNVTTHRHYLGLQLYLQNEQHNVSYRLTHKVLLVSSETYDLRKIFISEYKKLKHSPTSLDPQEYGKVCERIEWDTNQMILLVSAQQFLNSCGSKESVLLYFQPSCQQQYSMACIHGLYFVHNLKGQVLVQQAFCQNQS